VKFLIPTEITKGRSEGCPKYVEVHKVSKFPLLDNGVLETLDNVSRQKVISGKFTAFSPGICEFSGDQ
jgi:hypothetical protein